MASRNIILKDKDGNQIAPATIATQVKYDSETTLKDKIDELIYRTSIFEIDSINIVAQLPTSANLVEKAMYLVPQIEQLVPGIPNDTGYNKFVIVANVDNALIDYASATEFYLFADSILYTRGSYPTDITFAQSGTNTQTPPQKAYKYTVGGAFAWEEITISQSQWESNTPIHKITNVIYANDDIIRKAVGGVQYSTNSNIIDINGGYINQGIATTYDSYFVYDGVLYTRGTSDLSYIVNNLLNIIKPLEITENGTYEADNLNAFGYSPITVNVTNS